MADDNVVSLNHHRMKAHGEKMFLCCPCGNDSGFQVVCVSDMTAPVIAAIVCSSCGADTNVTYGKIEV
jgi:transcription elongation factor Elf1